MKEGDYVAWRWGNGLAEGVIKQIRYERTEIISKGKKVVRLGTGDNPAVIIDHKSGNTVLKLASEIQVTNGE